MQDGKQVNGAAAVGVSLLSVLHAGAGSCSPEQSLGCCYFCHCCWRGVYYW